MRGETFRLSSTRACFGLEKAPGFITFEFKIKSEEKKYSVYSDFVPFLLHLK